MKIHIQPIFTEWLSDTTKQSNFFPESKKYDVNELKIKIIIIINTYIKKDANLSKRQEGKTREGTETFQI